MTGAKTIPAITDNANSSAVKRKIHYASCVVQTMFYSACTIFDALRVLHATKN